MNEQPSMKLMFKGYQGVFSDKSFCKLRRRRKCENEQSAVTLPCLPVSFQHITCAQVGNKYELTSALIGQKSDLKLPPNSGEDVSVFISNLGIILPVYYRCYKLASSVNLYRFTYLRRFPQRRNFRKLLVGGSIPNPLWTPPAVSAAHSFWILLLTDFCAICIEVQFSINEKWKTGEVVPDYLCDVWQFTSRQIVGKSCGQPAHK